MDNRSTDMMNDAIDLCSCYEPICEPPVNLLEEWQDSEYAGPEPTLENTSYYVKEPDGTLYFYCGNTKIKMTEHFAENGKSVGTLLEDVIQYPPKIKVPYPAHACGFAVAHSWCTPAWGQESFPENRAPVLAHGA